MKSLTKTKIFLKIKLMKQIWMTFFLQLTIIIMKLVI